MAHRLFPMTPTAARIPAMAVAAIAMLGACSPRAVSRAPLVASSAPSAATAPAPTPNGLAATTVAAASAPPGAATVGLLSDPAHFATATLTVKSGTAVFFLQNIPEIVSGQVIGQEHNFVLGTAVGQPLATSTSLAPGKAAVFTVAGLAPGTYTFYCSIQDHAAAGMVGTLTVTQ